MLAPLLVVPPWSNAFRYSSATDLRCSSVMVCVVMAIVGSDLDRFELVEQLRAPGLELLGQLEGAAELLRRLVAGPAALGVGHGELEQCAARAAHVDGLEVLAVLKLGD